MAEVNLAYDILGDADDRQSYDTENPTHGSLCARHFWIPTDSADSERPWLSQSCRRCGSERQVHHGTAGQKTYRWRSSSSRPWREQSRSSAGAPHTSEAKSQPVVVTEPTFALKRQRTSAFPTIAFTVLSVGAACAFWGLVLTGRSGLLTSSVPAWIAFIGLLGLIVTGHIMAAVAVIATTGALIQFLSRTFRRVS
jgi:hypothetical protein